MRPMIVFAGAVRGDAERVVRHIQKISTRHNKSTLEPSTGLTGIMPCETCLCVFKGALNTVDGPKTFLGTGHKNLKRSSVRHLPFVLEEVSGQGFPCESLTAKTPSI